MLEEGMHFYETPISIWLSYCLNLIHKRGGKPMSLALYQKEEKQSVEDLMQKIDKINNDKPWQN